MNIEMPKGPYQRVGDNDREDEEEDEEHGQQQPKQPESPGTQQLLLSDNGDNRSFGGGTSDPPPRRSSSSSSKSMCSCLCLVSFLFGLAFITMTAYGFLTMQQEIVALQHTVTDLNDAHNEDEKVLRFLQTENDGLSARLQSNVTEFKLEYKALSKEVSHQTAALLKLSNITTNNVVLDELNKTTENMQHRLDAALVSLQGVVDGASGDVHQVKDNITVQMSVMNKHLNETLTKLNNVVSAAQTSIEAQVALVQDNINEYVEVTNKQFEAENDFVKYQLAGMYFSSLEIDEGYLYVCRYGDCLDVQSIFRKLNFAIDHV